MLAGRPSDCANGMIWSFAPQITVTGTERSDSVPRRSTDLRAVVEVRRDDFRKGGFHAIEALELQDIVDHVPADKARVGYELFQYGLQGLAPVGGEETLQEADVDFLSETDRRDQRQ